jgi:hypothetical protein
VPATTEHGTAEQEAPPQVIAGAAGGTGLDGDADQPDGAEEPAGGAEPPAGGAAPRSRARRWPDLVIIGALVVAAASVCLAFKAGWRTVLWSDEVWRADAASRPGMHFWSDLRNAGGGPSALGWLGLTRLVGNVLGWHGWALRTIELGSITLLGGATYLLARRFVGRVAATVCGLLVVFNQQVLYQGIQLKPYSLEMLVTVLIVGLWVTAPRSAAGPGATRSRLIRFAAVGLLALTALPAPFVVGPLAVADMLSGRGLRGKLRAGAETLVAVIPVAAHTLFFVSLQGRLRQSHYWDPNFASGRSAGGVLRFAWEQSRRIVKGLPPDVTVGPNAWAGDPAHLLRTALTVLPFVVVLAWALGVVALIRTHAGRLLIATVFGAEVLMFVASADRAWPFGAIRTNVFVIGPMLILAAAGLTEGVRLARRALPGRVGFAAAAIPVTALVTLLAFAASASTMWSWQHRNGLRYGDQMPEITLAIRKLMQPGDMAVVTGGMAHSNFRYQMGAGIDGPPAARTLPRLPEQDLVLVMQAGDGTAAAAVARHGQLPSQIFLVMALGTSGKTYHAELDELRRVGYCGKGFGSYRTTGILAVLRPCDLTAPAT